MNEMHEPEDEAVPGTKAAKATSASSGGKRATCAISGEELSRRDLIPFDAVRPTLAERILADFPNLGPRSLVSWREVGRYRARYVAELLKAEHGELTELDKQVAASLERQDTISQNMEETYGEDRTLGERLSDQIASFGGSWTFIISFFIVLSVWIAFNMALGEQKSFDPYPFILLNLVLSCIAALQAPIIMMSQKRLENKDRKRSEGDYRVNLKAELEIRHLHEKMDHLLTNQFQRLAEIQQIQLEMMQEQGRRKK